MNRYIIITTTMPRRQKQSLADFLSTTRSTLNKRDTDKIVGHRDWINAKNSAFDDMSNRYTGKGSKVLSPNRNNLYKVEKNSSDAIAHNRKLVDTIINFTIDNDWQQIDGGEHNNMWINSSTYPDKIFAYGKITELSTGEVHYFPVSNNEEDPKGIAMHNIVNIGGKRCTVVTNQWTHMEDTRRGKREERRQMYIDDRNISRDEYEQENAINKLRSKEQKQNSTNF
jgi:hypothetical protein